MIHENFHTKHSVFTASDVHVHAYITQLYIMSIQPVKKAVLGRREEKQEKKKAVNGYLIKNSKGERGELSD